MKIIVDAANLIQEYCVVGSLAGGQDFAGVIPDNFEQNFKPNYFKLENDTIVVNADYKEPNFMPEFGPNSQQKFNAEALLQLATIQSKIGSGN